MEDIPLLAEHFLHTAAKALNRKKHPVPSGLPTLLATYSFPGNIRELEAMIFDALSRHKSGILSLDIFRTHLAKELGDRLTTSDSLPRQTDGIVFPRNLPTIKQMTKLLVGEAMNRANGNQSVAGIMLGISQQALSKRLKQEREQTAGRKS